MYPDTDLPHPDYDAQFYAGVPAKRALAWLMDSIVIAVLSVAATALFGIVTLGLGFMLFPAILFLVSFLYRWLTIAGGSATWGMRFMGIELRSRSGDRLDPLTAAVHTGIFLFLMASMIGWALTVTAILVTRYNQGLPDLVLGTTAINRPV